MIETISVSHSLYVRLKTMAEEQGSTVSEMVEKCLVLFADLPPDDRALLLDAARLIAGRCQYPQWVELLEVAVRRSGIGGIP